MMQWILENGWAFWLVVMLLLLGIEMLSLDLWFAMLAGGALVATFTALADAEFWLQLIVFSAVSLILMLTLRPFAMRMLRNRTSDGRSNVDRLINSHAVVVERVTHHTGLIRVHGDTWTARTTLAQGIAPGEHVVIDRVQGATAYISPVRTYES